MNLVKVVSKYQMPLIISNKTKFQELGDVTVNKTDKGPVFIEFIF